MSWLAGTLSVLLGIAGWFATNMVAKPILAIREKRLIALEAVNAYAFTNEHSSETVTKKAVAALSEASSSLRALGRGHSRLIGWYCKLMKYDLEEAAGCLNMLADIAGHKSSLARSFYFDSAHVALNAANYLSAAEIEKVRAAIQAREARKP